MDNTRDEMGWEDYDMDLETDLRDRREESEFNDTKEGQESDLYYDSTLERYEDSYRHNLPGKLFGVVAAIAGAFAHIIRTFVVNLIFGSKERYAIRETFQNALKTNQPLEKDEKDTKSEKDKDGKQKGKDEQVKGHDKDFSARRTYDKDIRDHAAEALLDDKQIKNVFSKSGMRAIPLKESDEIYLIYKSEEGLQKSIYGMSKTDLLNGDGRSLASALYAYGDGDKIECALKSAMTVAAVQYLANKQKFHEGQLVGDHIRLAYVDVKTERGGESIAVDGSARGNEAVDVFLNGKVVATVTLDQLDNYNSYKKQLEAAVSKELRAPYQIRIGDKDTITFEHTKNGVSVRCSRPEGIIDLGNYAFKTEADVRYLAKIMQEENIHTAISGKEYDARDLSFVVGMLSNPDMKPDRNRAGEVLSTFTGEPEAEGGAHLYLKHTDRGVELFYFSPTEDLQGNNILAGSYHTIQNISNMDVSNLLAAVRDCRELISSNIYVAENYKRPDLEIEEDKDYFDAPIIGDPKSAQEIYLVENKEESLGMEEAEMDHMEEYHGEGEAIDLSEIPEEDAMMIMSGTFPDITKPIDLEEER